MDSDDILEYWRLFKELALVDAAILIVGGDPSEKVTVPTRSRIADDPPTRTQQKRSEYPGFDTVYAALKAGVASGQLAAKIPYRYSTDPSSDGYIIFEKPLKFVDPNGAFSLDPDERYWVAPEPKWDGVTVAVSDLKDWLVENKCAKGFFFPSPEVASDDFADPNHPHFSPELALAVAAWRGLKSQTKFPGGVQKYIVEWIFQHTEAWKGKKAISILAVDRIKVVANWHKGGPS